MVCYGALFAEDPDIAVNLLTFEYDNNNNIHCSGSVEYSTKNVVIAMYAHEK